jgi:ubiquinone/menaquinone biosynthesis C-methylase UbiE
MKLEVVLINILFFLILLSMTRYYISVYWENDQKEGFIQKDSFLLKTDQDIYDEFYVSVYDKIFVPSPRIEKCRNVLLKTEPYIENSVFLDVGSGTGMFANTLSEKGYSVIGIDNSETMIEYSQQKYPSIRFIQGDVMIPMQFESNTFTHICCVDFTIYLFLDKSAVFQNIYSWLTTGGYLCLHLVDPDHFDTIIPSGKPSRIDDFKKYIPKKNNSTGTGGIETSVEFDDFHYKSKYEVQSRKWKWIETFTDKKTKHVRQNERSMFMDTIENIVFLAEKNGLKKIDIYSEKPYFIFKKI